MTCQTEKKKKRKAKTAGKRWNAVFIDNRQRHWYRLIIFFSAIRGKRTPDHISAKSPLLCKRKHSGFSWPLKWYELLALSAKPARQVTETLAYDSHTRTLFLMHRRSERNISDRHTVNFYPSPRVRPMHFARDVPKTEVATCIVSNKNKEGVVRRTGIYNKKKGKTLIGYVYSFRLSSVSISRRRALRPSTSFSLDSKVCISFSKDCCCSRVPMVSNSHWPLFPVSRSKCWWYLKRAGRCEMVNSAAVEKVVIQQMLSWPIRNSYSLIPISLACAYIRPSTSADTALVHSSRTANLGWW